MSEETCCDKNMGEPFTCGQLRLEVDHLTTQLEEAKNEAFQCEARIMMYVNQLSEWDVEYTKIIKEQRRLDVGWHEANIENTVLREEVDRLKAQLTSWKELHDSEITRCENLDCQLSKSQHEVERLKQNIIDTLTERLTDVKAAFTAGVQAERERCARIAESYDYYGTNIAAAIRRQDINRKDELKNWCAIEGITP